MFISINLYIIVYTYLYTYFTPCNFTMFNAHATTNVRDTNNYSNKLIDFVVPNTVTRLRDSACADSSNLGSVTIPRHVTELGTYTFSGCTQLHSIELPDTLANIPQGAFVHCENLKFIRFPKYLTTIGEDALYGCRSLRHLVIPESTTHIAAHAFAKCSALHTVEFPNSVTSVGVGLFFLCGALKTIIFVCEDNKLPATTVVDAVRVPHARMFIRTCTAAGALYDIDTTDIWDSDNRDTELRHLVAAALHRDTSEIRMDGTTIILE